MADTQRQTRPVDPAESSPQPPTHLSAGTTGPLSPSAALAYGPCGKLAPNPHPPPSRRLHRLDDDDPNVLPMFPV